MLNFLLVKVWIVWLLFFIWVICKLVVVNIVWIILMLILLFLVNNMWVFENLRIGVGLFIGKGVCWFVVSKVRVKEKCEFFLILFLMVICEFMSCNSLLFIFSFSFELLYFLVVEFFVCINGWNRFFFCVLLMFIFWFLI